MGGEFGHGSFGVDGPLCSCGNRGCWEVFASNSAALRYYAEAGGESLETFEDLLTRVASNDACALQALERMGTALGQGAARIAAGLGPGVIVFVGELTRVWPLVGPVIEKEIAACTIGPKPVRVVGSDDGAMARLHGSVALVLQKHFVSPAFA
jgi:predicted NBD/HSP70 family sugar kinase